jgi:CheY-like chemotaxis protein
MAHILVIDDEADMRFILKEVLGRDGHTVDVADNGKTGVSLAELHDYDLIITDVIMPEMDGIEVLTALKLKKPGARVIVMTGGSAKIDKEMLMTFAKAMRAHKVVSKPLDLKALRVAVNELLTN